MSKLIIIRGPLGVGKSTVAKKLTNQLDALYISIDDILVKNNLDVIEGESIPLRNFISANEIILPEIEKALKKRKVVVDGNFYFQEAIEDLKEKVGTSCEIFTLNASLKTCKQRNEERGNTHPEIAVVAVHNLVYRFEHRIGIDTENKTSNDVVQEILAHISK